MHEVFHEKPLHLVIIGVFLYHAMPEENPLGVSVNDEDRTIRGVKKNGVGRFRAYAVYIKEFLN